MCPDITDISIINVSLLLYYYCIICNVSKSDAIHLLESSMFDDHGFIYILRLLFELFDPSKKIRNYKYLNQLEKL